MASLNLSANGPSISKSYQAVIDAPAPTGAAASSSTYAQWAVFSVSTPLANAFQQDAGGKESVLKVQSSGDGDLTELIDEFSDGRAQFAFAKVKDPNTGLPKYALIAWCGEGVPERTKGYFTSYQAAVSKVLQGYHVEITARSDRDLTPESIVQKISDASGSKYGGAPKPVGGAPPPKPATKPVFMPTQSGGAGSFNPLGRARQGAPKQPVDDDGWGADAPQVTRSQLEKVQPAYQPTKVDMPGLTKRVEPRAVDSREPEERSDVVKGVYQPVGKVDIAALRREAAASSTADNRATPVKGAYEPVGKVDIAAIRAKAQPPPSQPSPSEPTAPEEAPKPVSQRASAFSQPERLSELPKPKVSNRFGGAPSFTGTKAPMPSAPASQSGPVPPVGASRTFADKGGKTPAQIWAEKKGMTGPAPVPSAASGEAPALDAQNSGGGGGWKSGYAGKSWAPVQTAHDTGRSAGSVEQEAEPEQEEPELPAAGRIGALREAIGGSAGDVPGGSAPAFDQPPPLDTSNKPNAGTARGVPMPGLPSRPAEPDSPEPESPIRVAMPVSHTHPDDVEDAHAEQEAPPPPMPARAIAEQTQQYADEDDQEEPDSAVAGRGAAEAVAQSAFGHEAAAAAPAASAAGIRALAQYDYDAAEDNEIDMREGEYVTHIEMVDDDWWMGQNARGQTGLFPSNYVEVVEDDGAGAEAGAGHAAAAEEAEEEAHAAPAASAAGHTATALYDYEAGEDNELSFPEGGKITGVEFPDDDWWSGFHNGHQGLFPANYVELDQ